MIIFLYVSYFTRREKAITVLVLFIYCRSYTPTKIFSSSYESVLHICYTEVYCIVKHANRDTHSYLMQITIIINV